MFELQHKRARERKQERSSERAGSCVPSLQLFLAAEQQQRARESGAAKVRASNGKFCVAWAAMEMFFFLVLLISFFGCNKTDCQSAIKEGEEAERKKATPERCDPRDF